MRSREKRTLAIHDALGRVRVGRSYRKSQIPLTSLASYQADGARLRYGFLYGPLGIYFFFTCDGYIFAIGAAAGSRSRAKREENPVLQVSLASERSAPLQHASYHRFVPFQQPYMARPSCFRAPGTALESFTDLKNLNAASDPRNRQRPAHRACGASILRTGAGRIERSLPADI